MTPVYCTYPLNQKRTGRPDWGWFLLRFVLHFCQLVEFWFLATATSGFTGWEWICYSVDRPSAHCGWNVLCTQIWVKHSRSFLILFQFVLHFPLGKTDLCVLLLMQVNISEPLSFTSLLFLSLISTIENTSHPPPQKDRTKISL